MAERRKKKRKSGDFKINLSGQSSKIITDVKNISTSGIYCQVDQPITYMKKVMVELELPVSRKKTSKISCEGVVVRCDRVRESSLECYDTGVFFTNISEKDLAVIDDYVHLQNEL
ncbi:PilZ domain-containing protein [PVC group bacterium]|nr:PilZ domain-containing protein [PVC group bacterium]